ncbi:MAG: hypothetical protein V1678_05210 [Candidatus Aenigmatarchaeota archaeon]
MPKVWVVWIESEDVYARLKNGKGKIATFPTKAKAVAWVKSGKDMDSELFDVGYKQIDAKK